jgi:hypothetical protein
MTVQFEEMVKELKEECNISEIIALDQSDQESDYEKVLSNASGHLSSGRRLI